ncbi:hypothetical protein ACW0FT_004615 [Vibrio alginolyticus]
MFKKIILLSLAALSSGVYADTSDEINEWYIAQNEQYLIRDSINDGYYANLSSNQRGDLNVYLQFWDETKCKTDGDKVMGHDPLYVNDKLVKYSQACNGSWRTFFPSTEAGRKYIVSQFKKKNLVEITTYKKDFKVLFSAKGFTKLFNEKRMQLDAI